MKKVLLFAASLMLLSCGGGMDVKEIEFHSDSDIKDASAIKVLNISAPALMETGALSGKITCSAEIEVVNDLSEVSLASCYLALLDKNGALIKPLASKSSQIEFAELFKTPGKKTIVFESEEGLSPTNIKTWIDQTEAVQIKEMWLKSEKEVGNQSAQTNELSRQTNELSRQINDLLKDNKLEEANDLLTNTGFGENLSIYNIVEKYDPIYFKVVKANVQNGDFDAAEDLAVYLKSAAGLKWSDCSVYKYLKSEYENNSRDFSALSPY